MTKPRAIRATRALLRRRFGVWPLFEARNMAVWWPSAVWAATTERREVKRLKAEVVVPPASLSRPSCRPAPGRSCSSARFAAPWPRPSRITLSWSSTTARAFRSCPTTADWSPSPSPATSAGRASYATWASRFPARPIAFLDDDNEWQPHHLAGGAQALERGADLVYAASSACIRTAPVSTCLATVRPPGAQGGALRGHQLHRGAPEAWSAIPAPPEVAGAGARGGLELVWRLSRRKQITTCPRPPSPTS